MDKKSLKVVIGIVIFGVVWLTFLGPAIDKAFGTVPKKNPSNPDANQNSSNNNSNNSNSSNNDNSNSSNDNNSNSSNDDSNTDDTATPQKETPKEEVKKTFPNLVSENDLLKLEYDPNNGGIKKVVLKKFENDDKTGDKILFEGENLSFTLGGVAKKWKVQTTESKVEDNIITVKQKVLEQNLTLIHSWKPIAKDSYEYEYTLSIFNDSSKEITIENLQLNCGYLAENSLKGTSMGVISQSVDFFTKKDEDVNTINFHSVLSDIEDAENDNRYSKGMGQYSFDNDNQNLVWIAVKNQYFATIVEAESSWSDGALIYDFISTENKDNESWSNRPKRVGAYGKIPSFILGANKGKDFKFKCYIGPQKHSILKEMDYKKEAITPLSLFWKWKIGWLGFISSLLLGLLNLFYSLFSNYGVAIICLTVSIKLALWRITGKSHESMKKMAALAPKMKEINEKYSDNPQEKQKRIIALYRENGANPVGGCLPILLQMPIYVALFSMIRGAIELRHSSFLWVNDLSQPDTVGTILSIPINPFAIIWVALMVLQQKLTPTSTVDPRQKMMMTIMPIVIFVMCYRMPSGITLYFTFQTIMTMLQYYLARKKDEKTPVKKVKKV